MKIVTTRQKEAVKAIEEYVGCASKFKGDINNYSDVSDYLSRYLKFLYSNNWAVVNGY